MLVQRGMGPVLRLFTHLALGGCVLLSANPVLAWTEPIGWPEQPIPNIVGIVQPPTVVAMPSVADVDQELQPTPSQSDVSLHDSAPDPKQQQLSALLEPARQSRSLARPREVATLPILMYHHVDDLPRTVLDHYRHDLTVSTASFRKQLALLQSYGASTVGLGELMDYLQGDGVLPDRAVVLTFDDGYDDNYLSAYPLLRELGLTATFFVVANLVGTRGYMTWEQLREMQINGMAVESHSLDHIDLAIQPRAELQRQLAESRRILELNLMRPVRYLNYPSGRYTPQVITAARAAGYRAAVTVNHSLIQERAHPYELGRVRVKGSDTIESLAAKMVPTYWRYPPRGVFGQ